MAESEEDYCDDDYSSQATEYNFQNRMPHNYQHTMTKAELRRSTKPIMEKRRRARINRCLNELKSLILDAMKKDPARHSKLEKADILEMTVKHLQTVQKRQLSAAMVADPGVVQKFRGGFEECATEVSRYIEGLDGIDMGVRRRLAAHLSSCVTNIPAARNDITSADTNNNSSSRVNAISASLRLIPSRLPNGDLALLVPDAQSLPNNVLPFFQLAEHTKMAPNMGHQGFNQVTTTTVDKLPDVLRLDTSPSHPSAFTAVNKLSTTVERTPSPTLSSVSSSADRNAPATVNNMSSEVSSTSEQLAESSTDPSSSSFNSSTSSLSPQNIARNPAQPLSRLSPNYQNTSPLSTHTYPPQYMQDRSHLQNALQSPPKQQMDGGKTIEDVGYNLSQKHQQQEQYSAPKFSYPEFPKTDHAADSFPKQNSIRFPQTEYTYMDGLKSYELFPSVKEHQETFGGRRQLDLKSSEFSLPLTVETNLERCPVGKLSAASVNGLPAPIDYSKNVGANNFQITFVPSLKRRRLEAAKYSSKPAEFGESQSFSPRIIVLDDKSDAQNSEDFVPDSPRNSGSEASTSENVWRPW